MKLLGLTGLLDTLHRVPGQRASEDDLLTYHSEQYVHQVRALCEAGGGDAGSGAIVGPDSYGLALHAVGGVIAAVDAVMTDQVDQCYALVRPPGHHAMVDKGIAHCIFGNIVLAARHGLGNYGLNRVVILDWDVHHGNGTQHAFYDDPGVLFISIHQEQWLLPEWGWVDQCGVGDGEGYTVNIPLPAGSGNAAYSAALEEIIAPIVEQYQPELIMISAGQDASALDPRARMIVTTDGYRAMTRSMQQLAERLCGGKLVLAQEGGYSDEYAPYCTLAIFEALLGQQTAIEEPISRERSAAWPASNTVSGDQREALDSARKQQSRYWSV